jgi:hypothetical protein
MECQIWLFLLFINQHLAVGAVEVETDDGAVWHTQVAGLLALGVRIRFAAVTKLVEQAVAASHQWPIVSCLLHSFNWLIGMK